MAIFGITYEDVVAKLNPTESPNGIGGINQQNLQSMVEDVIVDREDYVASRIPAKYRFLLTHIPGEIVIGAGRTQAGARGGETEVALGMSPVSNVTLFKNYKGQWLRRTMDDALPDDEFSVNETTGIVTLATPLSRGDRLVATYDHTGMSKCLLLRGITLNLICYEVALRVYRATQNFEETYGQWSRQAFADLYRMELKDDGKLAIDFFDKINLVAIHETVNPRNSPSAFDRTGGGYQ